MQSSIFSMLQPNLNSTCNECYAFSRSLILKRFQRGHGPPFCVVFLSDIINEVIERAIFPVYSIEHIAWSTCWISQGPVRRIELHDFHSWSKNPCKTNEMWLQKFYLFNKLITIFWKFPFPGSFAALHSARHCIMKNVNKLHYVSWDFNLLSIFLVFTAPRS